MIKFILVNRVEVVLPTYFSISIIRFTPIGVLSIIAGNMAAMTDIRKSMEGLVMYIVAMLTGSVIHGVFVLPGIYFLSLRRNPFLLLIRMSQALLTGFGTASRYFSRKIFQEDLR